MDIVGDRRFVEVPGGKTHELPPLLVKTVPDVKRLDKMMGVAAEIIEQEDMVPPVVADFIASEESVERRKMDLALNLVDQYLGLLSHWHWGDAVVEWIRQCEITFGERLELRNLLRSEVWPHAGRSSFVTLLEDKAVKTKGVQLEKAVGLRLAFRQMPPIRCCSDQFLFYLNNSVAQTAYRTWLNMTPSPISSLPPERFQFEIVNMSLEAH
ncbi:MAG TPA: hypothetical protein VMF91_11560 [Bryobacteraceae bacterium]|nr:hypothetical protein [Bryobacteraceae bacterium]